MFIDPTDGKSTMRFGGTPAEVLYHFGRDIDISDGCISSQGKTAVFVRL